MTRTVVNVTICVASDSLGDLDMNSYLKRLEAAVRSLSDIDPNAKVNIFSGGMTRYEGLYSDTPPHRYDILTDRLTDLSERVFQEMCSE